MSATPTSLASWGDFNKRVQTELCRKIHQTPFYLTTIKKKETSTSTGREELFIPTYVIKGWTATIKSSKAYEYVGMDYATAQKCAAAKTAKYTRSHHHEEIVIDVENSSTATSVYQYCVLANHLLPELMATVSVVPAGGGLWNVSISVDETDVVCYLGETIDSDIATTRGLTTDYD